MRLFLAQIGFACSRSEANSAQTSAGWDPETQST
jgi:hypothetical protein